MISKIKSGNSKGTAYVAEVIRRYSFIDGKQDSEGKVELYNPLSAGDSKHLPIWHIY
ncbi:MAG: hypothetical protein PHY91_08130 [Tissierellia bacterium]|nr:hypothetical protein [Tissierellia bacterium]MDD4726692.1 hypothetical protein [Tissierellia bacterium]